MGQVKFKGQWINWFGSLSRPGTEDYDFDGDSN